MATDTHQAIFPSFFMLGFECSTFVWMDGQRKDYIQMTGHDTHLKDDCERIHELGVRTVREAVRWPMVDKGRGQYDWSTVDPVVDALADCGLTSIWDLCHYGFPDGCDPFTEECRRRFVDYCRAAAERLVARTPAPRFFTPINEITFFAAGATDLGWMYPFAKGRQHELKMALCRMEIEAVKAIREIDPAARMVHVDPIVHVVPPPGRPDLSAEAQEQAYAEAYEAWDILAGLQKPDFGGSPDVLDIVGVNIYHHSQVEIDSQGARKILGPRDPRRKPLRELLTYTWERYQRPLIIGETSGYQDRRAEWLRDTMEESLTAMAAGVDLHGICLYPCVDVPDWHSGDWAQIGVYDLADKTTYARVPCDPYITELRRWQRLLDQPERIAGNEDGLVRLSEVRRHAADWTRSVR